jgi:hypothetical protein
MQNSSPVELADRVSRRRAIGIALAAGVFLLIQVVARPVFLDAPETASISRVTTWAVNAILLLLLLFTGGGLAYKSEVRALVNDEISRNNYKSAVTLGFWIAMSIAMVMYAFAGDTGFTAREAVYIIVTPSVGLALLAFSWLELRAHRDA